MVRKPNYCKGIVIVHGKSELLLAEHIKSNLHLPIEIYAESNGKTSIQIESLMTVLGNNIFKNKKAFNKKYIVEEEKGQLINFSVMPIMDLDDTSEEKKKKYLSGEMFKNHWLSPYIVPIWNKENLDEVLLDLGLIDKLPNNKEKGKVYRDLFPKNVGKSDKQQVEDLMKTFEKSNLNFIKYSKSNYIYTLYPDTLSELSKYLYENFNEENQKQFLCIIESVLENKVSLEYYAPILLSRIENLKGVQFIQILDEIYENLFASFFINDIYKLIKKKCEEKYKYKIACEKCGQVIYRKRFNINLIKKYRCGKCKGELKLLETK